MSLDLSGAWELVSDSHVGLAVLTDTHFNMTWAEKNRQPFAEAENPSDAEAARAFRSLQSAAGTYEISGAKIIFHRQVNRNPNWTGVDAAVAFEFNGDTWTLKDFEQANVWKKLK